jgi:hypothetical protein
LLIARFNRLKTPTLCSTWTWCARLCVDSVCVRSLNEGISSPKRFLNVIRGS